MNRSDAPTIDPPSVPGTAGDPRWRTVLARDARADGSFVYAVRTTGVYCRPSCPSRRPRPENVVFFALPEAAEAAGFRPCRRCRPEAAGAPDPTLAAVRRVCRVIETTEGRPPTLATLAGEVGLSPTRLQRVFKRILGVSPRAYAEARRHRRVRERLAAGDDVAGALYEAGYGSSSRLYEAARERLGMTPATYRRGGAGARIAYAIQPSPLDLLLVAATEQGVALVALGADERELEATLRAEFPAAEIRRDDRALGPRVAEILAHLEGETPHVDLPVDVRATAFQWRVWQELRRIPRGETASYREIAERIGQPAAARAVGRACATNPVALVVPCHRAVRGDGGLAGYRWGIARKRALIDREHAAGATSGAEGAKTR